MQQLTLTLTLVPAGDAVTSERWSLNKRVGLHWRDGATHFVACPPSAYAAQMFQ